MGLLKHYFDAEGPGAALAVVRDDAPPIVECVGMSDVQARTPITRTTPFELASVTKAFTAAATLLLAERGQLSLAAPLHELLAGLPSPSRGRAIVVRDLLQHTSGLADYLADGMYTPLDQQTRAHVLASLPLWVTRARPGRAYEYSNTNYVVLATVIAAVSGVTFREFLVTRLFRPFDLRATTCVDADVPSPPGTARGYRNAGTGLPQFELVPEQPIDTNGDGGVISCLDDLVRWQSLFWTGAIVSPSSLSSMTTPGRLDSGATFPYGLGLQIEEGAAGDRWCGHGGSWTNATTIVGRYFPNGTTVVVLSNEFMAPVERISRLARHLRPATV